MREKKKIVCSRPTEQTLVEKTLISMLPLQSWCSHHQWNKYICGVRDLGEQRRLEQVFVVFFLLSLL